MNKALELHDSSLDLIEENDGQINLWLNEAIVHHTEGEPGIDKATCYIQKLEIKLTDTIKLNIPKHFPIDISDGYFVINNERHDNMIKIPIESSGDIEVFILTMHNERLKIQAKKMLILEHGEPEFLQEFE